MLYSLMSYFLLTYFRKWHIRFYSNSIYLIWDDLNDSRQVLNSFFSSKLLLLQDFFVGNLFLISNRTLLSLLPNHKHSFHMLSFGFAEQPHLKCMPTRTCTKAWLTNVWTNIEVVEYCLHLRLGRISVDWSRDITKGTENVFVGWFSKHASLHSSLHSTIWDNLIDRRYVDGKNMTKNDVFLLSNTWLIIEW